MKRIVSVMSIVCVAGAIAAMSCGCASIPFTNQPDPAIDSARVAQIERAASGRGVEVHWVNLPTRNATPPTPVTPPTGT